MCQASLSRWLELGPLKPGLTVARAYPILTHSPSRPAPEKEAKSFLFLALAPSLTTSKTF